MIPGMTSEEYEIGLRHQRLLSRIMHRIATILQVEQLELSGENQNFLENQ
jgi:hypothetical protein